MQIEIKPEHLKYMLEVMQEHADEESIELEILEDLMPQAEMIMD